MKTLKWQLLIVLFCVSGSLTAGDGKIKKSNNKNDHFIVQKMRSLLLYSDYASINNLEGDYIIIYNVDENNKINISEVRGLNEKMKKDICDHVQGKKIAGNISHETKILKVSFKSK